MLLSRGPGKLPLPDVASLSRAEAILLLKKAGFRPRTEDRASATVAVGQVIETVPPAGSELRHDSVVIVLVSSGPAPVVVPTVVGQSLAEARSTLEAVGLKVGMVEPQALERNHRHGPGAVALPGGSCCPARSSI